MTNKLNYSRTIDLWLTSDTEAYDKLIDELLGNVNRHLNKNRFRVKEHRTPLFHYLADIICTYYTDPKRYLAYNRNANWFSTSTIYSLKRFARKPTLAVIDTLAKLGYVENHLGFRDRNSGVGFTSRVKAKKKLITLVVKHGVLISDFTQLHDKQSIRLKSPKDENGTTTLIDYKDTSETKELRQKVTRINETLDKYWIDIKITDEQYKLLQQRLVESKDEDKQPVDFNRKHLYRVFNNGDIANPKFNQGGRFYGGWWQQIPSEYRSRLRINGKKTVELDYSAMHFYMMYSEKGLATPTSDPYTVDGIDRKSAKVALNIALNASSKSKALSAIKNNQWPEKTIVEVTAILDKLLSKHEAIAEYFYTGKGIELQYKDSQIAESVMLNMWKLHGVVALPVHDSFIVPAASNNNLKQVMGTSFKEITGYAPKLDKTPQDQTFKSTMDILAQQVERDDVGALTKLGVNAADTWDAYKGEQNEYTGYRLRAELHGSKHD
jgi:hypothetical protein